jgi:hypothetical protein
MKTILPATAICLSLLVPEGLFAGGLPSGRSVGMGGAYTQIARGVEAAFWNPANLGFAKMSEINLNTLSFGVDAGNNSLTLGQYNRYNGSFLTSEDKQTILNAIPDDGLNVSLDADILAFGISRGNLALFLCGRGTSGLLLPKDPIQTLFFGNEINDTLVFSGSDAEAFASMDLGLSWGRSVWKQDGKELLVGISARCIRGLVYQKVNRAQGEIFTLETGINGQGDFLVRSASGGWGFGLDLGVALEYDKNWSFGLCFANLMNRIRWSKNAEERVYQVEIDSLLAQDFDLDSMIIEHSFTYDIASFRTRVPISMRAGVAHHGERSLLSFDLEQGFGQGMGASRKLSASLGAEYAFRTWLDLRGGISLGGDEKVALSSGVGFNLGFYHLDLGMAVQRGLWPTNSKGINLAISNGFRF